MMKTYKKPGVPEEIAINFQEKMSYILELISIDEKTLAKYCDVTTKHIEQILNRPDHRITALQYLAMCNAIKMMCATKLYLFKNAIFEDPNRNNSDYINRLKEAQMVVVDLEWDYILNVTGGDNND